MIKIDMDDQLVTKAYHISMLAIKQAEIDLLNEQLAALRSPAPAATVTGWRLLEVGEVIQDGDELKYMGTWDKIYHAIGERITEEDVKGQFIVRRRLTPPALTDAMRALVEACQPFLKRSMWPYPNEVDVLRSAVAAVREGSK